MTTRKTAITVGSPEGAKRAALYFDHVIHIWLGPDVAPRHPFWPDEIRSDHEASANFALLTHRHALAGTQGIAERFDLVRSSGPHSLTAPPLLLPKSDGSTNTHLEHNYLHNVAGVLDDLATFLARHGVQNSVFVATSGDAFAHRDAQSDPAVVISGLKLVDTRDAKWNQITEAFVAWPSSWKTSYRANPGTT